MSSVKDTASFFARGNSAQFEHVLALYPQVLKLKAENKCKKPDELIRLDDWYQNKLPQLIKKRGKDQFMVHEELVKTMKWKQTRGKFFPQLSYLIKVNTPRAVQAETRKAFRKLPNLEQAITALSNLKGVGTTMASALLAAAAPETAPFMADECLMAIPEIEGIDYTTREYMNFVQHIQVTTDRLNRECHPVTEIPEASRVEPSSSSQVSKPTGNGTTTQDGDLEDESSNSSDENSSSAKPATKNKPDTSDTALKAAEKKWSPHKVELALWTHYVASELQPDLLENIPEDGKTSVELGADSDITAASSTNSSSNDHSKPAASSNPAESDGATATTRKATNGNSAKVSTEESNHTTEEPSDESNCDTEHGKSGLGSDESSKDLKFGVDSLDDCTKSEDSLERPSTTTPGKRCSSNTRKHSVINSVMADDDSLSSPKPSIEEDRGSSADEDDEESPSPGKKLKFD